jgi:SAM-dependent methyltransferase
MWKMFGRAAASGSSPEFWDESWDQGGSLLPDPANDRVCENQGVVWRLLNAHLRPDRLFLEGGCGCANWVRYFSRRGYRSVGLDFAPRTVERVKQVAPAADVRVGDVTAMPFEAGTVHSYYSGGVVEHFESGPEAALREARRVLADDGWFFCSVPDASTLRRNLVWPAQRLTNGKTAHPVRPVTETRTEPPLASTQFYQYLFTPDEFSARLHAAGFTVQEMHCYSLLWGLMELPGLGPAIRAVSRPGRHSASGAAPKTAGEAGPPAAGAPAGPSPLALGKTMVRRAVERILIKEDVGVPIVGPALALALEHCANMRLYVARPR